MKLVDSRNTDESEKGGSMRAVHGVTKFADLSESEFKRAYLTFKKNTDVTLKTFGTEAPEEATVDKKESQSDRKAKRAARRQLKESNGKKGETSNTVDWSGVLTTPVNDQVMQRSFDLLTTPSIHLVMNHADLNYFLLHFSNRATAARAGPSRPCSSSRATLSAPAT